MTVAPAPSDAALVARLRSRDRTAWEDVYALYGDRLYKFAYHLAGNPHDAADLVQETFVRVLPKLESLDPDTLDLGAYLFATQRNLFLKQVERTKRQQPVDEIPEPDEPRPLEDDPQRSLLLADQQERVRHANAALAPRQRLVLALRELEDRSYAEIGEIVGLRENAVAQLISRARLRLRDELRLVEVDRSKLPAECQEMLPALSAYLDGQLKGAAADRTLAHVETCENCQKALIEMREASKLYRALLPIPFPELFGRIDDALASSGVWDPTSSVLGGLAKSKGAWLVAAVIAVSVGLVAVLGTAVLWNDVEPVVAPASVEPPTTTTQTGDTTAPELTLPQQAVVREATSTGGAPVSFVTRAQDDVDGAVVVTCAPASGETFAIGVTEVSCSAQDAAGNESEATFEVEVADSTAPAVSIPAPLTVEAKSAGGATISYRTRARDRVDRTVAPQCTPAGGEVFPLGETTVECTARDTAGNVARKSFKITVVDSTPPELTLPESIAVEAGAPAAYKASARDIVDGKVDVVCSVPSGRVLHLGQTIVACTSEDGAGNVARQSFVVRVGDTTAPILLLPDDLRVEATGRRTRVAYSASAREQGGPAVPAQCRPTSRSRFRLGVTTVRCSATDPQGNTARGSFEIAVVDSIAPKLATPSGLTAEATGPGGAQVDFQAKASDRVDRSPRVTCSPASGSTFPLGATNVRCTARDASDNSATATFVVNVVDTTAPVLALPPNRTVQATSTRGAPVSYTVSASDLADGPVTPTCTPASGATFAVGTTQVTCTARDKRGNQSAASFAVTVTPFPQPDLAVAVTPTSVTITNRGNAAAGVFTYAIQGVGTFTVRGLAAGASITRTVTCASIQRTVTVDPQNQVAESNEANNTARIPPC